MTATIPVPQVTVREAVATVEDRDFRYWESGSGDPIVFLHRGSGPRWSRTHDLLAAGHRVIMLEMPGFGSSSAEGITTAEEYATCVRRALAQLVEGRYHLVGNSFGGLVAAWISVRFPDEVESVTLIAPAIHLPEGFRIEASAEVFDMIDSVEAKYPERHYARPLDDAAKVRYLTLVKGLMTPDDPDLLAGLGRSRVPTLVMFGTDDQIISPELGRKYPVLNPAFFLTFVYDAGHAVDGDRPEALADALTRFTEYTFDHLVERRTTLVHP